MCGCVTQHYTWADIHGVLPVMGAGSDALRKWSVSDRVNRTRQHDDDPGSDGGMA